MNKKPPKFFSASVIAVILCAFLGTSASLTAQVQIFEFGVTSGPYVIGNSNGSFLGGELKSRAFSATNPLTDYMPGSGSQYLGTADSTIAGPVFYGGYNTTGLTGSPDIFGVARVTSSNPGRILWQSINPITGISTDTGNFGGLILFNSSSFNSNFTSNKTLDTISLNLASVAVVTGVSYDIRMVVRDNLGAHWLSEGNRTTTGAFSLDVESTNWMSYDPVSQVVVSSFSGFVPKTFIDPTAVGFYSGATFPGDTRFLVDVGAFQVTAIPEPSTAAFLGLSLLMLTISRRRKR